MFVSLMVYLLYDAIITIKNTQTHILVRTAALHSLINKPIRSIQEKNFSHNNNKDAKKIMRIPYKPSYITKGDHTWYASNKFPMGLKRVTQVAG